MKKDLNIQKIITLMVLICILTITSTFICACDSESELDTNNSTETETETEITTEEITEETTEETSEETTEKTTQTATSSSKSSNTQATTEQSVDSRSLHDVVLENIPSSGSWATYVCNLSDGSVDTYNNHSMQAASLIKLFIMGAIYENYSDITSHYDKSTVDSNLYSMITVSSNTAANELTTYLGYGDSSAGMSVVNSFCQNHGFGSTHMGRLLLASNQYDDNYTSVVDCGNFLRQVRNGSSNLSHTSDMFNLLANQQRKNKIPSKLPSNVKTANKTGELSNVENDAAILYGIENELVIVVMSENLSSVGTAQKSIGNLALAVYNYLK